MHSFPLVILSYHKFTESFDEYPFSRTYEQFGHDISKKIYDWITIDDARACTIKACEMLRRCNIRAKLFVSTSLIGTPGYCNWDDVRKLSLYHDIENHSHFHKDHSTVIYQVQQKSILMAQEMIIKEIGRAPRYFVAPYNRYNENTDKAAESLGLVCVKDRITIHNYSK